MTTQDTEIRRWSERLLAANVDERREAAQRLAESGEQASVAAVALARATDDLDESVCHWATEAVENLRSVNAADAEALSRLLDSQSGAAYWGATLLGRIGAEGEGAVPALTTALTTHPDLSVRERAAWALGRIGPAAKSSVTALRDAAVGPAPRLASLAAEALRLVDK